MDKDKDNDTSWQGTHPIIFIYTQIYSNTKCLRPRVL